MPINITCAKKSGGDNIGVYKTGTEEPWVSSDGLKGLQIRSNVWTLTWTLMCIPFHTFKNVYYCYKAPPLLLIMIIPVLLYTASKFQVGNINKQILNVTGLTDLLIPTWHMTLSSKVIELGQFRLTIRLTTPYHQEPS